MKKEIRHIIGFALTFVLALTMFLSSTSALQRTATTASAVVGTQASTTEAEKAAANSLNKDEILWLARVIYSETKRPHEQELVAWVVRNRVETAYRGKSSYQSVVLDPWQFSAFNRNSPKRLHYTKLEWNSNAPGFSRALSIAAKVATAQEDQRPFSETTRHFFSRQSMVGGKYPQWARASQPVKVDRQIEADRFRFYEAVM